MATDSSDSQLKCTSSILTPFFKDLISPDESVQKKAAKNFLNFITTRSQVVTSKHIDVLYIDQQAMINSQHVHEKKGGIYTTVVLLRLETSPTEKNKLLSRGKQFLLWLTHDEFVNVLVSKAIGYISKNELQNTTTFGNSFWSQAINWLEWKSQLQKKIAALLLIKELARNAQSYYHYDIDDFYTRAFSNITDPNLVVRDATIKATRACLALSCCRDTESRSKPWVDLYKQAKDYLNPPQQQAQTQAPIKSKEKPIRDDKIHCYLLVILELMRISSLSSEFDKYQAFINDDDDDDTGEFICDDDVPSPYSFYAIVSSLQPNGKSSKCKSNPYSEPCKNFISQNYNTICDEVMNHLTNKTPLIITYIVKLLPWLGLFNPQLFLQNHLITAIQYLKLLTTEKDYVSLAFNAIGLLILALDTVKLPKIFLQNATEAIRSKLTLDSTKKVNTIHPHILKCMSYLIRSGFRGFDDFKRIVSTHLEQMDIKLSEELIQVLRDIIDNDSSAKSKKFIQTHLLKYIFMILIHKPVQHPGVLTKSYIPADIQIDDTPADYLVLALHTLANFGFDDVLGIAFHMKPVASTYLIHSDKNVRIQTVKTCTQILLPTIPPPSQITSHFRLEPHHQAAAQNISFILDLLLTAGVTDAEHEVRLTVYQSLNSTYDGHMAQSENLQKLFAAFYDELFEIRLEVLSILGRLSVYNPAYLLPSLRKTMVQLLDDLRLTTIGLIQEQSSQLLACLITCAPILVKSYCQHILDTMLVILKKPSPPLGVTMSVLQAIAMQAQVSQSEMKPYSKQIIPLLKNLMQDATVSSMEKTLMVLWTLGQLLEYTGYVLDADVDRPQMMDILYSYLKVGQYAGIRRQSIRVLGLLGALDPHKYLTYQHTFKKDSSESFELQSSTQGNITSEILVTLTSTSRQLEDFYPKVAIRCLLRILNDPSCSSLYPDAAGAFPYILQDLGENVPVYVKSILPTIISIIENSSEDRLKTILFSHVKDIISISGPYTKEFMPKIFQLITSTWINGLKQKELIELISELIRKLGSEFRNYIPKLLHHMLSILVLNPSESKVNIYELMKAIQLSGTNLDDYLHMLLPPLIKLLEISEIGPYVKKEVLKALRKLSPCIDFIDFISPIVHTLSRIIYTQPDLRDDAIQTLIVIIPYFGKRYELFIPMMQRIFDKLDISNTDYNHVVNQIKQNKIFNVTTFKPTESVTTPSEADDVRSTSEKFQRMNPLALSDAWLTSVNHNVEDWQEWLRRLCLKLVDEVPNKSLRALSNVCKSYGALSREIFNATFISCWEHLAPLHKEEVITSLDEALSYSKCPEIIQVILNLVEFIEHIPSITLPLKTELLAKSAYDSRAYAKALRYKEKQFKPNNPGNDLLASLIDLNNKLQVPEASIGVLDWAEKVKDNAKGASWYESLQYWPKALDTYKELQYAGNDSMEITLGTLRCLDAMSEWEMLLEKSLEKFKNAEDDNRTKIADIACYSAWGLNKWNEFDTFVRYIPESTQNGSFFRVVTCIRDSNFIKARDYIQQSRNLLDTELSVLVGESYTRAYKSMVFVQNLSELEEVINVLEDVCPSKKEEVIKTWWDRLQGCYYDVEDWQRILLVRSLIISPVDDAKSWIKYANLCRKSGRMKRAEETLALLQKELNPYQHLITYAHFKYRWATTQDSDIKNKIIDEMDYFINDQIANGDNAGSSDFQKHMSKCYLLAGKWNQAMSRNDSSILSYFKSSTEYNPRSYKAWHAWAITNFDIANEKLTQTNQQAAESNRKKSLQINLNNILNAIEGFFKSISLVKNSLQDALRLLTLWFHYGHFYEINDRIEQGIQTTTIDTWLQVIPQLIARIDSPSQNVRKLVHTVLTMVGNTHPQALVYPVTVASKSMIASRSDAAKSVLNSIAETQAKLVSQAVLISEELIRISILWHEQWHDGLEEASRLYFGENNVQGMLNTLDPLHKQLDAGPQTLKEMSFSQAYGRFLNDAQEWCKKYKQSKNPKDLNQAWDDYYYVFKRISIQLPELISLELKSVSLKLSEAKNMVIPVPGTYQPGQESILISEISPKLTVISSKQRPRRLTIKGSNGIDYQFLLKGHEDLRQDERVMQLFGLVNNLLTNDSDTFKKQLFIQRYSVIPLSPNSGLIGWAENCDTMHQLIKDYREKNNVILNIEHRSMLKYSPDYEHLPLIQKVEVFLRALENSRGDDLARIMWLKSPSSEIWFTCRTNYTRSLAVMSVVGYILGLGDRHPSNLMIDKYTGRVLHIDFGDCFEVAMTREKFPEKIPFRLTRMLVKAMEVTGLSGTFKNTCQSVMRVIRLNEDSIMAVLEAFVYDPLLSWRLADFQQNETSVNVKCIGKPAHTIETGSSNTSNKNIDEVVALHKRPTNIRHFHQVTFDEEEELPQTELNKKALKIKSRINDKLKGNDFLGHSNLSVEDQVQLLINQSTSNENLCQCYIGWCPFW